MNFVYTNGRNKDFAMLCHMLDENLNEIIGREKQKKEYDLYNTPDDIQDVILLYDDEKPVACAGFKYYDAGIAEMKRVFIRKEYRGRGLSKELVARLESGARSKGCHTMILETGKPLEAARGLYRAMGYTETENYGQYKNLSGSVCMRKEIAPV